MTTFLRHRLWPAIAILIVLTIITGVIYPLVVTAVAQVAFPGQANGSFVVTADGRTVGSSLIGQAFDQPQYFWGRLSAAGKDGYDASGSAGSNLGPTSQALIDRITADVDRVRAANGGGPVPVDLVTTSASGLDPEISPAAADYQVARVAAARTMSESDVRAAVARHTEGPLLGFLGEPRVNVLLLNLDLDGLLNDRRPRARRVRRPADGARRCSPASGPSRPVRRGRLRVYLGMAPGVGKTYRMLEEGHRRLGRGTDLVVGFVEAHGRPDTLELLDGLEIVPRRRVDTAGSSSRRWIPTRSSPATRPSP